MRMIPALTHFRNWQVAALAALLLGAVSVRAEAAAAAATAVAPAPLAQAASTAVSPVSSGFKHLGVASCATSVCHSKIAAQTGRNVALNEVRIWEQQDRHAQAYRALERPLAQAIAKKLGLVSATSAKICLDCHADNVPDAMRGPKFVVREGIQCEACHGGSERWIKSHSDKNATHAANLALGMYPTENPVRRAQLCLSCHLGTDTKFANHRLMGAGHPRMRFELDTFSVNQPPHYQVDADYVERKGKIDEINLWVAGQIESERVYLTLLQGPLFAHTGLIPELAFYDCFGCHHALDKPRWTPERAGPGIAPGTLRLQKQNLLMLQAVAESIGEGAAATELVESGNALVRAGQTDAAAVREDARKLSAWLNAREPWTRRAFSQADITNVRKTLLRYAASDRASDYGAAEQVILGVESMSYALGDHDKRGADIDALYNAVKTNGSFDPAQFAATARLVAGHF
jgi:Cytochrome c554 and c-prime